MDTRGVFKALADIAFDKWAIVELDRVPDAGRTPKQCAEERGQTLWLAGLG